MWEKFPKNTVFLLECTPYLEGIIEAFVHNSTSHTTPTIRQGLSKEKNIIPDLS